MFFAAFVINTTVRRDIANKFSARASHGRLKKLPGQGSLNAAGYSQIHAHARGLQIRFPCLSTNNFSGEPQS